MIERCPGPAPRLLAVVAVVLIAGPFTLLLVLVESGWEPLRDLDRGVAEALHAYAVDHPGWVRLLDFCTNGFGPGTLRSLALMLATWYAYRGAPRLAAFLVTTVMAGWLIQLALKQATGRPRPAFPDPVAHAPGWAFPSSHALTAALGCGVLLVIGLPALTPVWRAVAGAGAVTVAGLTGFTRIALGVHWVSDVLAGWVLGVAIVTATTAVFGLWPRRSPYRTIMNRTIMNRTTTKEHAR